MDCDLFAAWWSSSTRLVSRIFRGSADAPGPSPARPAMPLHQKQAGLAASKLGVGTSKKHRAFVASDEQWYNKIFDPSSDFILTWNRIFLFSCFVALLHLDKRCLFFSFPLSTWFSFNELVSLMHQFNLVPCYLFFPWREGSTPVPLLAICLDQFNNSI